MRILINALFLIPGRVGGSETYLRALIDGLARQDVEHEFILCIGSEAARTFTPPNSQWRILTSPTPSSRRALRLAVEQTWLPGVARQLRADVIHSAGYTTPFASTARRITTIFDMNYRRHPEDMSVLERLIYSVVIPISAQRSERILTLSEAAAADIVKWTGIARSKVEVTPLAARPEWPGDARDDHARVRAAGVNEPFVLGVAASHPHKNTARLIQAFPIVSKFGANVSLVMTGSGGRAQQHVAASARAKADLVRLLGWVDDALLASLYRRALALVFPSLYEGFGLPIIEAMALGTPVLTSNFGAMQEVANGAAELVDSFDVESIRRGLQHLVDSAERRAELRRLGLQRERMFSWETTARRTLAAYTAKPQQTAAP
jgi:glycosyltransferase involved in cell wall biosynthesis